MNVGVQHAMNVCACCLKKSSAFRCAPCIQVAVSQRRDALEHEDVRSAGDVYMLKKALELRRKSEKLETQIEAKKRRLQNLRLLIAQKKSEIEEMAEGKKKLAQRIRDQRDRHEAAALVLGRKKEEQLATFFPFLLSTLRHEYETSSTDLSNLRRLKIHGLCKLIAVERGDGDDDDYSIGNIHLPRVTSFHLCPEEHVAAALGLFVQYLKLLGQLLGVRFPHQMVRGGSRSAIRRAESNTLLPLYLDHQNKEKFDFALQLLELNVVSICFRAGIIFEEKDRKQLLTGIIALTTDPDLARHEPGTFTSSSALVRSRSLANRETTEDTDTEWEYVLAPPPSEEF